MSTDTSVDRANASGAVKMIGLPLVVASALSATFGLIFAQFIDSVGDGLLAEFLGGDAVLYNNRAEFTGASDIAYVGGFALCFVLGLIFLLSYPSQRGYDLSRLAYLWVTVHLLRQALTDALLLSVDADSQLARAYATFDAPPGLDTVLSVAGGVGLVLVGLGAAAAFLVFAPHSSHISTPRKRLMFALWLVFVPAVISVFAAIPFFAPDAGSGVVPALPLTAVMFLLTLAAAPGTKSVQGPQDHRTYGWPYGLAGTLIVVLVVFVVLLQNGVSFNPTQWG
ncbi:hypothetical protein BH23ACT4_BH23ACT4_03790 [soil metagenome]